MNPAILFARYYLKTYWFIITYSAFFLGTVFVFSGEVPSSMTAFLRRDFVLFIAGAITGLFAGTGIAWLYECFLYDTFRKVLPSFVIVAFVCLCIGLNEICLTSPELYNSQLYGYIMLVVFCGGMLSALTLLALRTYKVVWQLMVYFACLFLWFIAQAGYIMMMKDYFFPH